MGRITKLGEPSPEDKLSQDICEFM